MPWDADQYLRFGDERTRAAAGYPRRVDGRVLFPFRRLFVVAFA
jgi:trans-aconitate methyltransferase